MAPSGWNADSLLSHDLIIIQNILDIHHSNDMEGFCQLFGVIHKVFMVLLLMFGDLVYCLGVNARPLEMLHNTGDEDVFAVANGIYLKLLPSVFQRESGAPALHG